MSIKSIKEIDVELPDDLVEEILVKELIRQYDMFCDALEKRYEEPIGHNKGGNFYSNREKDIVALKEYLKSIKIILASNMSKVDFDDYFKIQGEWESLYIDDEKENK